MSARATARRLRRGLALGISAALLGIWAAGAAEPQPPQPVRDVELVRAIEFELSSQLVGLLHPLEVRSLEGVVTVSGRVDSLLDRDRVLAVLRSTRGVRGIVDRIEVQHVARPALEVMRDVEAALESDPAIELGDVGVTVRDGEVRLAGDVDSWQERRFAVEAARGVPGIHTVVDEMSIDYSKPRSDAEIREDVARRIAGDVRVDGGLVEIDVSEGQVRLAGVVGSVAEREQAYDLAWVTGVKGVDASDLEIRWWARDLMRRIAPRYASDAAIEEAVRQALSLDPRVRASEIGVSVRDGVVTLTGVVGHASGRLAARDDARNIVGVVRVEDLLSVRVESPPGEEELARRVRERLAGDALLARHALEVSVNGGKIVLSGNVDSTFDRRRAETLAAGTYGVQEVENGLEVDRRTTPGTDPEIVGRVNDALFWDARIDEQWIRVDADSGVVTLTGWVDDWREHELAEERALGSGAAAVLNRIEVKPARAPATAAP